MSNKLMNGIVSNVETYPDGGVVLTITTSVGTYNIAVENAAIQQGDAFDMDAFLAAGSSVDHECVCIGSNEDGIDCHPDGCRACVRYVPKHMLGDCTVCSYADVLDDSDLLAICKACAQQETCGIYTRAVLSLVGVDVTE